MSQNSQGSAEKLAQLFKEKQEIYFRFPIQELDKLREIGKYLSVDHNPIRAGYVYAYGYVESMRNFLKEGIPYEVLEAPSSKTKVIMRELKELSLRKNGTSAVCSMDWNFFPTYGGL